MDHLVPAFLDSGPEESKRLCSRLRYVPKSTEEVQIQLYADLASQTHWHLILVGASGEQEDFFEFENCYGLKEFISSVRQGCKGIPMIDFYRAREQFGRQNSLREIFEI